MSNTLAKATTLGPICRECPLYNSTEGVCAITIIKDGEDYEIMVKPNDRCHWEALDLTHDVQTFQVTLPTSH